MPQRDYAVRSKRKGGKVNKTKVLTTILAILGIAVVALWLLKENAPAPTIPEQVKQLPQKPSTNLPSKPEEVYSYIRDLETREVITDPNIKAQDKLAQLSQEQLKLAEEKRKEEEARLQAIQQSEVANANTATTATPASAEELAAMKAQEQKKAEAEAKRKAEEARKAEQLAKAEKEKAAKAEKAKTTQAIKEAAKKEPAKVTTAVAAKSTEKTANQNGKFGLQCGAFKNKAQAENMQARLAMAGFNARIIGGNEWNRVLVGPVGDRAAASRAQSNARSVAECVIIGM